MSRAPERCVIYVPGGQYVEAAAACMRWAADAGYLLEGIVLGDWPAVTAMMLSGRVEVVLVADVRHLPARYAPRIEVVNRDPLPAPVQPTDRPTPPATSFYVTAAQRRPRVIA